MIRASAWKLFLRYLFFIQTRSVFSVRSSFSLTLMLSTAALALAGCAGDQPATPPQAAVPVTAVEAHGVTDAALAERVGRLEQNMGGIESDVANLQEEVTAARPKLAKVETMERHFRQLSLELDRINQTYDVAATPEPVARPQPAAIPEAKPAEKTETKPAPKAEPVKAEPAKAAPKPKAAPAAATSGPLKVNQVRIGEQPNGKTRIVLDSTQPAKINYDIDNGEKILVIEVPGAAWAASQSATLKNSPLVSSYKAESDAAGSRVIIQLKADAQVLGTSRLAPANGAGHRVFLDLGKK